MKEALYYVKLDNLPGSVTCLLCPHKCVIASDKTGLCRTRKNISGTLFSLTYEEFSSVGLDPIEKKPLYHFYPATQIFSLGTVGCNFVCKGCQNWGISQSSIDEASTENISPSDAVRLASDYNAVGIAYTYNEPLINYEYVIETARKAREAGLKNVLVTNGYINEEPLTNVLQYIDAMNIDVKSYRNDFYKHYCGGSLGPVLRTSEIAYRRGCHIEFTNLLIPGLNDSDEVLEDLTDWIYSLSENIPLHFSRYFPAYKMTVEATSLATLHRAREIAIKKLKHVYLGNVWEEKLSNTYCPVCQELLISRKGYTVSIGKFKNGCCGRCNSKINIIM